METPQELYKKSKTVQASVGGYDFGSRGFARPYSPTAKLDYKQWFEKVVKHFPKLKQPTHTHFLGNNPFLSFAVAGPVGGWKELGRTTLGVAGDTISVASLANKRYYMILGHALATGGVIEAEVRLNNDTGTNYAYREQTNGGADTTNASATFFISSPSSQANDLFLNGFLSNMATKEKLHQGHSMFRNTAGAANVPDRREHASKWANTVDAINRIDLVNLGAGDYAVNSELVVLGWDKADVHTDNFWTELASVELGAEADQISSGTITAKKYLWIQAHIIGAGAANRANLTFNNDVAANYAFRHQVNGGADSPSVSQAFALISNSAAKNQFINLFLINRSANEKLGIGECVSFDTVGSGTAPDRRETALKWANTAAQITEVDLDNTDAGGYAAGSILKVYGSD